MPPEAVHQTFIRDDIRPLGEYGVDYSAHLLEEAQRYIRDNESRFPPGCRILGDGVMVPIKPYRYQDVVFIEHMLSNGEMCSLALSMGMPYPTVI